MSGRLQGRAAIVVGAARGIGRGIAEVFLEEGAKVVLADANQEAGAETVRALNGNGEVVFARADASQREEMESVVAVALERFGRVDILVQNAGIYPYTLIEAIDVEEWDRVLAVNLRGCFLAAQACLPPMKAQGHGRMIFTSSMSQRPDFGKGRGIGWACPLPSMVRDRNVYSPAASPGSRAAQWALHSRKGQVSGRPVWGSKPCVFLGTPSS